MDQMTQSFKLTNNYNYDKRHTNEWINGIMDYRSTTLILTFVTFEKENIAVSLVAKNKNTNIYSKSFILIFP